MAEKTCNVFTGNQYPKCVTGLSDYTGTGQIASCSVNFSIQNNKLYCSGVLTKDTFENTNLSSHIFSIQSYNLTATGFIKNVVGLSNQTLIEYQDSQNLTSEINSELMQVLLAESFYIFAFGILLGGFISMIRKASHTR